MKPDTDKRVTTTVKSDKYLLNRRKVRSKIIKMKESTLEELRKKRITPKGEGAVDNTPEEGHEVEEETVKEYASVDTSAKKSAIKDRMKSKMMQMTADHDRKKAGMNVK